MRLKQKMVFVKWLIVHSNNGTTLVLLTLKVNSFDLQLVYVSVEQNAFLFWSMGLVYAKIPYQSWEYLQTSVIGRSASRLIYKSMM